MTNIWRDDTGGTRLPGVDVLRGLSVVLVTLHHIHLRFKLNGYEVDGVLPKTLNQVLFWSGYYAVIIFFVISGFLITRLSIRRWGQLGRIHIVNFYRMRAARILPSLFLMLIILSALHLLGVPAFTIRPERASLGQALWAGLTFRINWLEGHHGYLPGDWDVLWSLSVEEMFYLAFPLLCLILRRENLLLLPLGCLFVLGPINRVAFADQDPWNQYAYLCCMDGIAFGCLAALAGARIRPSERLLRIALVLGAVLACVVLITTNEDSTTGLARFGLNITLLEAGVALMLLALGCGVGNTMLSKGTSWIRTVGRGSYEIYLVHMLVVLGVIDLLKYVSVSRPVIPLWYAGMLALSVLLGLTLAKYFSEPMNKWLREGSGEAESPSTPFAVRDASERTAK